MRRFLLRHRPSVSRRHPLWGENHRLRDWVIRSGCLTFRREQVARGVAVGLLVGFTPTVGFQTLLMLGGCLLVGGNFPAAFLVSWVSNPLTMTPLYLAFHELGEYVFGDWLERVISHTDWLGEAMIDLSCTALGSLMVAIPAAVLGYLATLGGAEVWQRRRHAARDRRRRARRALQQQGGDPSDLP